MPATPNPAIEIERRMNAAWRDAINAAHAYISEDCSPGSKASMEYAISCGYEDYENFDPRKEGDWPDFNDWAMALADERVSGEANRILDEAEIAPDGRLTVWRAMIVPTDWIEMGINEQPIGKCWAWDSAFAIAHQGHGWPDPDRMMVRIRATVDVGDIDWTETLALNAAGEYTVGDEKEIRLHDAALVEVDVIEWAAYGQSYKDGEPVIFEPGSAYPAGKACAPALAC